MSRFMAEFLGTMLLIILGDGVVASVSLNKSKGQNGGWIVVTTAWAVAVAVPALIFGAISGAHFNPAVTIAFAAIKFKGFAWSMVPSYIIAQMLGAMLGAALVWITYLPHWSKTEDPAVKDRKSTRLNSSHANISYAVFCLKKKKQKKYVGKVVM